MHHTLRSDGRLSFCKLMEVPIKTWLVKINIVDRLPGVGTLVRHKLVRVGELYRLRHT